jgi:hypothetical protein
VTVESRRLLRFGGTGHGEEAEGEGDEEAESPGLHGESVGTREGLVNDPLAGGRRKLGMGMVAY